MSGLRASLREGKLTFGSWITLGHTAIAEIMARASFDWLTVDLEHSAITIGEAQNLIRVIELVGCMPLVRVSHNDATIIKRVMDAGAHGVIVPMVNTDEDARRVVGSVRYPPDGFRGVGLARAQAYGVDFEGYRKWVAEESVVIVQIEHIEAVKNLAEILSVEGVDGFLIGPYDLSASLGIPGKLDHPEMKKALEEIRRVSERLGVTAGYHVVPPLPAQVREKVKEGYRFIAYSTDFLLLGETCRRDLGIIRENLR